MSASTIDASAFQDANSEPRALVETFTQDWYIRTKASVLDATASDIASHIAVIEHKVTSLYNSLQSQLNSPDIQLLSQRFMDESEKRDDKSYTCYWLIGLPTMASAQIAEARKIVRAWGMDLGNEKVTRNEVRAKFVKREIILQQNLKPDTPLEDVPDFGEKKLKNEMRRTGESFKKIKGSNPAQIRKQFLRHAMGGEASDAKSGTGTLSGLKLRPPRDVFNRLKYDEGHNVEEYVVGYIDRDAGILEKPVLRWQEYEEQELIAYFKHVPDNEIVWDRAKKTDLLFKR